MWSKLAFNVLRYRLVWLLIMAGITVVMLFYARKVELTYNFAKVIPTTNQRYQEYLDFKSKFGEDGNVLVIGAKPKDIFDFGFFSSFYDLGENIKQVPGVLEVVSVPNAFKLFKDTVAKQIHVMKMFPEKPHNQQELDSLKNTFLTSPFYRGLIYNPETNATLMAVRISQDVLDSKDRIKVVSSIKTLGDGFGKLNGLEMHYSGLPLIRTVMATQVADELKLFLILAMIVTGLVLFLLLRSIYAVIYSMLVVAIAVICCLGTIVLFGFKITLLTGLIPPLIVVIGITNCVYLLNKYHIEYVKHGNKMKALNRVIEKIGMATLFTNLTAAIGFGVFYFTSSTALKEFGLIAGINIAAIFIISIIVIPCLFSYLPPPKTRHTWYLDFKFLKRIIAVLDNLVMNHRGKIFIVSAVLVVVSIIGMLQLKSTGFIVDDIPHNDKIYTDLLFFQDQFHGVMPFEIMVDTKKKGGVLNLKRLKDINKLEDTLATYKEFSRPLSLVEGVKYLTQSYYDGNEGDYRLPNELEKNLVLSYLPQDKDKNNLISTFIDSTRQTARISMSMADVGSQRMQELVDELQPKILSLLDTSKYKVTLTGTSMIFLEGNHYIIAGLTQSLLLAFLLIAFCMGYLFRSVRMVFISLLPNLVPLAITAGIMGYFSIPLKPSTVLIYSIAFGIAIDNAIRFLAKYQQELHRHDWNIQRTVSVALHEAGISIIYTSIILFFGFIIFTASSFGGTFYLGLLTSITLVVAMFNNLLLLPSLIMAFQKWLDRKSLHANTPADSIDDDLNDEV